MQAFCSSLKPMFLLLGFAGVCAAAGNVQIPTREVADAVYMPVVSLGTGGLVGQKATSAVETWIGLGATGIDTAFIYFNQGSVGKAIRDAKVPRESLFITTKIPGCVAGSLASRFIDQDLQELGVDYIDLLLIHFPAPRWGCAGTWKVLQEYHAKGAIKAIGVSNFKEADFQAMLPQAAIVPAVNQIELNVLNHDDSTIAYCAAHNIVVQAYSPLGRGGKSIPGNEAVRAIAASHNVTAYQVALKWILQHGHILTFLSESAGHQQADADLFGFGLTDQEMSTLDALQAADDQLVITV